MSGWGLGLRVLKLRGPGKYGARHIPYFGGGGGGGYFLRLTGCGSGPKPNPKPAQVFQDYLHGIQPYWKFWGAIASASAACGTLCTVLDSCICIYTGVCIYAFICIYLCISDDRYHELCMYVYTYISGPHEGLGMFRVEDPPPEKSTIEPKPWHCLGGASRPQSRRQNAREPEPRQHYILVSKSLEFRV